ncbi:MAG: type I secretion system permease/ATPase [Rhodocyclaceae bacterium]|nr:type I secretion system permease/ATPase [Rhodocyclaceae bacterium]
MRELLARFRPYFLYAGVFSFFINLLLLVPTLYMLQVFDRVLTSRSNETLVVLTVASALALVVMALLDQLRGRLLAAAGIALDSLLGPQVLKGLLANAAQLGGTEYVHGLRDVASLRAFLTGNGIFAVFDAPWLPFYLILIFVFHPVLGIVATLGAAFLIVLAIANEKLTREPLEKLQAESRKAARYIDTSLRNAEVIGGMGMIEAVTRQWQDFNGEVQKRQLQANRLAGFAGGLTKFTRQFLQTAMLCAGAYLVIDQHVTAGVMMAATIILSRALAPVEMLISGWKSLVEARAANARLDQLLQARPADQAPTELPAPAGHLALERVVFAARGMDKAIIKGVGFELAAGEVLGLIGPSASGKSTLARLIIGLWRPNSGTVRLDGSDIGHWPRERLGPHIGYLPQDVELFAGTVAENIARLGEADSAAVIDAARRAAAHDMILRLPKGYDTPIGEGGAALSGGQRQRIALARALYGNPRLVVLDEPNANLDAEGEAALMQAMAGLKQAGVTLVVISHRPSLLAGADKLLVLRDGAVDLFGPRQEVLARLTRGAPPAAPLKAVDGGAP